MDFARFSAACTTCPTKAKVDAGSGAPEWIAKTISQAAVGHTCLSRTGTTEWPSRAACAALHRHCPWSGPAPDRSGETANQLLGLAQVCYCAERKRNAA